MSTAKHRLVNRPNCLPETGFGIATRHRNEHHHGQQLHAAGRGTEACGHPDPVTLAWRLAGWHDADMAAGNKLFDFDR